MAHHFLAIARKWNCSINLTLSTIAIIFLRKVNEAISHFPPTAETAVSQAESAARNIFRRHMDYLGPQLVKLMLDNEIEMARQEWLDRESGFYNNTRSTEPGLTIFANVDVMPGIIGSAASRNFRIDDDAVAQVGRLHAFHLQTGVYWAAGGGIAIDPDPGPDWKTLSAWPGFSLGYDEVVRIEGNAGEVWQNENYTWDGNLKG